MKFKVLIIVTLMVIVLLTACSFNRPVSATSNTLGTKVGTFTQVSYLGFPPMQSSEAATAKAAHNGGITKISTVDYNATWMIFMIKYTTIVTGE